METLLLKVWLNFIEPYLALLGGATLHLLFSTKVDTEKNRPRKTFVGMLILLAISVLLGLFLEALVVGYYSYSNLVASIEIKRVAWWLGAVLGFTGTIWIVKVIMEWSVKGFKMYLSWKFSNGNSRRDDHYSRGRRHESRYESGADDEQYYDR